MHSIEETTPFRSLDDERTIVQAQIWHIQQQTFQVCPPDHGDNVRRGVANSPGCNHEFSVVFNSGPGSVQQAVQRHGQNV